MADVRFYVDLRGLSRKELLEKKLTLEAEITAIREKLERARVKSKTQGVFADTAWWLRTHQALRIKGRQSQQIQAALSKLREEDRTELQSRFMDVARAKLPADLFHSLLEQAKA